MTKFNQDSHYQTEYHGILRHDEINLLLELIEEIEIEKVYGANNALIKAKMIKVLSNFEEIQK